jgi:hypothetical protein
MKNSVLMRSINTLYFRQNNSLILKLTSGQRKKYMQGDFESCAEILTRVTGFM